MYVRMSTESQNYSTDHQRAKIHEYALGNEIEIITLIKGSANLQSRAF